MTFSRISACFLLLPLTFACGHVGNPAAPPQPTSGGPFSAPPSSGYDSPEAAQTEPSPVAPSDGAARGESEAVASAAPKSAPASAGGALRPAPQKKADDRPGLGTSWGETRTSYVSNAEFNRADWNRPFALVSLNYNDESGVQAAARRAGNSYASFDHSGVDAAQGAVSVRLLDETGSPLPTASLSGRDYVAGSDGQRYVIQIENHTGNRFEAVTTVDGLDVIDGKGGALTKRGYLINPWSTLEIDGFRRSQAAVAAFRFGTVKDSYAARKGNDRNVGVIGVAFFHEQGSSLPWTERELERRDSANPFPGGFATPPPTPMAR